MYLQLAHELYQILSAVRNAALGCAVLGAVVWVRGNINETAPLTGGNVMLFASGLPVGLHIPVAGKAGRMT